MRNFVFDVTPECNGGKIKLKDSLGKESTYQLKRVKGNGCYFIVEENGIERDHVTFTMQDLRALYCLLTVKDK